MINADKKALADRYAKFTNDQLLEILENRNDYTAEAIEVLQAEIDKRQLSNNDIKDFEIIKQQKQQIADANAAIPLSAGEKIFFFFTWFVPGFVSNAVGMNYRDDGMTLKISQSRYYRVAGFVSMFSIAFVGINWALTGVIALILLVGLGGVAYVVDVLIFFKGRPHPKSLSKGEGL